MTTPVRQQYLQIKKQFPETIVLFRLGDFYETFDDDAKLVSEVCGVVLTSREMGAGNRIPLAGVPYHAVDTYIAKLIQSGHKVAIVEQQEAAAARGSALITRAVTPVPKVAYWEKALPKHTQPIFPYGLCGFSRVSALL